MQEHTNHSSQHTSGLPASTTHDTPVHSSANHHQASRVFSEFETKNEHTSHLRSLWTRSFLGALAVFSLVSIGMLIGSVVNPATQTSPQNSAGKTANTDTQPDSNQRSPLENLVEEPSNPSIAPPEMPQQPEPTTPPLVRTPTPTATPRPTPKPTVAPTPTPTPAPTVDVNVERTFYGYSNRTNATGCIPMSAGSTSNPATYCETSNQEENEVYYILYLRNNGSTPAMDYPVRADIDGQTVLQTITIPSNDMKTLKFSLPKTFGAHKAVFAVNPDKKVPETRYDNNTAEPFTYTLLPDKTPPTVKLNVSYKPNASTIGMSEYQCFYISASDDVDSDTQMTVQLQTDGGPWQTIPFRYDQSNRDSYTPCFTGPAGTTHTAKIRATDRRGNSAEASAEMRF